MGQPQDEPRPEFTGRGYLGANRRRTRHLGAVLQRPRWRARWSISQAREPQRVVASLRPAGRQHPIGPVTNGTLEVGFNRARFVQDQSISAAAPAILCPMLFRPKYFYALHFCVATISDFYCQPYDGLAFSSGRGDGFEWATDGQYCGCSPLNIRPIQVARCSSAACVQVVRIHERCV